MFFEPRTTRIKGVPFFKKQEVKVEKDINYVLPTYSHDMVDLALVGFLVT